MSGDIVGSTIAGSSIIGGAINVPTTGTGSRFSVDVDGNVSASNANISGIINADSGRIGQWIIDAETGNLQDIDAKIVFDPLIPELQFYTGSGGGRVKKVSISPQDTLSPSNAGTQTLNVTSSVTINTTGTVSSVASSAENQFTNFGTYYRTGLTSTGGAGSDGVFSVPQAGFVDVTLTVPNFGVTVPAGTVAHTTSYPNYSPPYNGFFHGGNSQPRTAIAQLYLEAVQVSTGTVVGSLLLGQATAFGAYTLANYYQGVTDEEPGGGGELGFISVTGDTLITLSNGDVILAKDLIEGERVLAWGWNSNLDNCIINEFSEYKVSSVKSRIVDKIYKISAGGKTIKVSDSHGFWLNDNNQIKATELVEGISEINIKDGNTIKVVKVDSVQIIHELTTVYTIEVPGVHNYISNDIISHNSGFWEYYPAVTQNSVAFNYTAGGTKTVSINISVADDIRLRYALRYGAQSGFAFNKDSTINFQNGTSEYFAHTVSSFSTAPTPLDSSLEIKSPTNFVEVKAGGIQVVSGDNVYVSIPRKPEGFSDQTMLHIEGGILFTNTILPSTDVSPSSTFNIGSADSKYANLNGLNISGLAVSLQPSVTTDIAPGVTTVGNTDSYAVLPGGTIIQWGSINDSTNPKTVVFPVTFPTSVSSVVCSTVRNSGGSDGTNHVYNIRRSQCDLVLDGRYGFWIAMGH